MRLKEDPVKDKRIVELNDIVEEVKESEEWEAVKMNILEIGIEKGMQQGAEKKMLELVEKKLKKEMLPVKFTELIYLLLNSPHRDVVLSFLSEATGNMPEKR